MDIGKTKMLSNKGGNDKRSLEILLDWELRNFQALKDANAMASASLAVLVDHLKKGRLTDLASIVAEIENIQTLLITDSE